MSLELIPVIVGALVGLLGIGLLFDAWTPDDIVVKRERRRVPRIERSRAGEGWIGMGGVRMAGDGIGRDTWSNTVDPAIAGSACMLLGILMNWRYLGARVSNRGALRRRQAPVDR